METIANFWLLWLLLALLCALLNFVVFIKRTAGRALGHMGATMEEMVTPMATIDPDADVDDIIETGMKSFFGSLPNYFGGMFSAALPNIVLSLLMTILLLMAVIGLLMKIFG